MGREYKDEILYHGSRGGIVGDIEPKSRERCDFGVGFYMGTNPERAKTLVATDPSPYFYQLKFRISEINKDKILELKDMEWANFVLYNRGRLDSKKNTAMYNHYKHLGDNKDVIIGPIADDAMNETMRKYMQGEITDKAFLESIRVLDYGIQYVVKTEAACRLIEKHSERELFGKELSDSVYLAELRRKEGNIKANEVQKKYRREGYYLDEILQNSKLQKGRWESR